MGKEQIDTDEQHWSREQERDSWLAVLLKQQAEQTQSDPASQYALYCLRPGEMILLQLLLRTLFLSSQYQYQNSWL